MTPSAKAMMGMVVLVRGSEGTVRETTPRRNVRMRYGSVKVG